MKMCQQQQQNVMIAFNFRCGQTETFQSPVIEVKICARSLKNILSFRLNMPQASLFDVILIALEFLIFKGLKLEMTKSKSQRLLFYVKYNKSSVLNLSSLAYDLGGIYNQTTYRSFHILAAN
jgi:hypothetical protein